MRVTREMLETGWLGERVAGAAQALAMGALAAAFLLSVLAMLGLVEAPWWLGGGGW